MASLMGRQWIQRGPDVSIKFSMFLVFGTVMVLVAAGVANGQQHDGFVSVDCGSNVSQYNDSVTTLRWESDSNYTQAGQNGNIPFPTDKFLDKWNALKTFRYFPEPGNRFCYQLPIAGSKTSFLLRAMFYHGNAPQLQADINFDVYVNSTLVFNVNVPAKEAQITTRPMVWEGIFRSLGSVVYVCLVPKQGVPFISSLELRQFGTGSVMDSFKGGDKLFLSNILRWNAGGSNSTSSSVIRYPADRYDRLWLSPAADIQTLTTSGAGCFGSFAGMNNSNSLTNLSSSAAPLDDIPEKVLADACRWQGPIDIDAGFSLLQTPLKSSSSRYRYAVFYLSEDSNGTTSDFGSYNITLNGSPALLLNASGRTISGIYSYNGEGASLPSGAYMNSTIQFTSDAGDVPDLYALELFDVSFVDSSSTNPTGERVLQSLKNILNLKTPPGDPCRPIPYEWIGCMLDPGSRSREACVPVYGDISTCQTGQVNETWNIIELNLPGLISSFNTSQIDEMLTIINELQTIKYLDLSSNRLSDLKFQHLMSSIVSKHTSFEFLDVSLNAITTLPRNIKSIEGNGSAAVNNFDISGNPLSTDLVSLNDFVKNNFLSLQGLSAAYTNLTGELNVKDSSYLLSLHQLILDGNHIGGTLDLTGWFDSAKLVIQDSTPVFDPRDAFGYFFDKILDASFLTFLSTRYRGSFLEKHPALSFGPTFSFSGNQISGVWPQINKFENEILRVEETSKAYGLNFVLFQGGIFLDQTPICKHRIPRKYPRAREFFCRPISKIYEVRWYFPPSAARYVSLPAETFIIILTILATFTLAGALSMAILGGKVIRKSLRNVQTLRQIQQEIQKALEHRQVHPPFYAYNDLKLATQNFDNENKLGLGAFGAVYKGKLSDETTIAVKRLFNATKEKQGLNEFLNEVVLINGIKHKNLVQLKGCCIREKERILVYEYAEEGNLAEALWGDKASERVLNWDQRFNVCIGIARGLCYLHEELQPRIIHRDIKPSNILLDKHLNAKIADFGLAKSFSEEESQAEFTHVAGTRGYFAPEYAGHGQLTEKADVFSFGILALEIVSGRRCILSSVPSEQRVLKDLAQRLYRNERMHELVDPKIRELLLHDNNEAVKMVRVALMCVQSRPNLRPTMSQVITMLSGYSHALLDLPPSLEASEAHGLNAGLEDEFLVSETAPHSSRLEGMEEIEEEPVLDNLGHSGYSNSMDIDVTQLSGR